MLRCPKCGQYLPVCKCPTRRAVVTATLPVVIATVFSRAVWAQSRPPAGKQPLADPAASAGGSVVPSGTTTVKALL